MKNARTVCAELCEVSRLALYLAYCGRTAGLHRRPLFSTDSPTGARENMLKEPLSAYTGADPDADGPGTPRGA